MPRYEVVLAHRTVKYRKMIIEAMSKDAACKKAKATVANQDKGNVLSRTSDLDSGWGDPMEPRTTTHSVRELKEG